jgi:hypothetical protein
MAQLRTLSANKPPTATGTFSGPCCRASAHIRCSRVLELSAAVVVLPAPVPRAALAPAMARVRLAARLRCRRVCVSP